MEPSRLQIEKFSNSKDSINFLTWKSLFLANISSKGYLSALAEQDEDLTVAKQIIADKADAFLLIELLNSIEKEPRQWALLNYPISETPTSYAGKLLWTACRHILCLGF